MKTSCSVTCLTDLEVFVGFEWGSCVGVLLLVGWVFYFQLPLTQYSLVFLYSLLGYPSTSIFLIFLLCSPLLSSRFVFFLSGFGVLFILLLVHARVYSLVLLNLYLFLCSFSAVWVLFPCFVFVYSLA